MKLIIAGSRTLSPTISFLKGSIVYLCPSYNEITEIVSGGASGVDTSAKILTQQKFGTDMLSLRLLGKYKQFSADWKTYGKAAGPRRNKEMAEYSDALLLIWDGKSKGSANMKKEMENLGKPVYEVIIKTSGVKSDI